MPSRKTIQVAAGIVWRQGRFLAARRPEGGTRAGFWEFPGGKREQGESIEQALIRELEEELGISCSVVAPWKSLFHDYPDTRVHLHFMHVTDFSGDPSPRDGQELRWVSPGEARELNFLPADRAVVAEVAFPGP